MADQPLDTAPVRFKTEKELRELVRAIIIELAPAAPEDPGPDADLVDDLGYHSLALLELAFSLEDEFNLQEIDEATGRRIRTINDVLNHVAKEFISTGRIG
jgi:acyl carrier protein